MSWARLSNRAKRNFAEFKPEVRKLPVVGGKAERVLGVGDDVVGGGDPVYTTATNTDTHTHTHTEEKTPEATPESPGFGKMGSHMPERRDFRSTLVRSMGVPAGMQALDILHRRCAHVNEATLRRIFKLKKGAKLSFCDACAYGKARKASARSVSEKVYFFLDEVHTDVKGPLPVESYFRNKYWMLVMEIHSRMTWVYFLRAKSEVYDFALEWLAMCKNVQGAYPIVFLSDGGEQDSNLFSDKCKELGVQYRVTGPSASTQNPFVERKHRTVQEAALALLHQAGLPRMFWEQAVAFAVYVQNRFPIPDANFSTPIEVWDKHSNKDHFRYCRVFGCRAWVFEVGAPKFSQKRAIPCVYLGLHTKKKAYMCYDPESRKILVSIHVTFNEGVFPLKKSFGENPLEEEDSSEPPLFTHPLLGEGGPVTARQSSDSRPAPPQQQQLLPPQPPLPPSEGGQDNQFLGRGGGVVPKLGSTLRLVL